MSSSQQHNPPLKPRTTKTTKTRRYRLTKRIAKRPVAIMRFDRGNVEQQISLSFPENSVNINVDIPKEKNPNLVTIRMNDLKFCIYLDSGKGFVYDLNGIYLSRFAKHDLKGFYSKIGRFLKAIKTQKG
jgi:hypothetical protein